MRNILTGIHNDGVDHLRQCRKNEKRAKNEAKHRMEQAEKKRLKRQVTPFFDAHTRGAEGFFPRVCASKKWHWDCTGKELGFYTWFAKTQSEKMQFCRN